LAAGLQWNSQGWRPWNNHLFTRQLLSGQPVDEVLHGYDGSKRYQLGGTETGSLPKPDSGGPADSELSPASRQWSLPDSDVLQRYFVREHTGGFGTRNTVRQHFVHVRLLQHQSMCHFAIDFGVRPEQLGLRGLLQ